ncbi:MAG: hypothetical protein IJ379_08180 [Lachnospiraceae bacterium]|nr:hypothetical protein [Lachnospiraceae bacterium]
MAILVESIVLCMLFSIPLLIMSKNPIAGIHNYPPAIIEKAIELGLTDETHRLRSKKTIIKKLIAAVLVAIICALIVYQVNGARSFKAGFAYTYLLWLIVDWYDAFVIDILWFCHDKRFILPGTEGMEAYKDYWFHIKGSMVGMLYGLPVALVVGGIVALLT